MTQGDSDDYQALLTYVQGLLGRGLTRDEIEHIGALTRKAIIQTIRVAQRLERERG